jgi:hypothetical protein
MGDEKSCRTTVFGREIFVVKVVRYCPSGSFTSAADDPKILAK